MSHVSRIRTIRVAAGAAAVVLASAAPLLAQPVLYLQGAQLDGAATAITIDLEWRSVLSGGGDSLPSPGDSLEAKGSPWIATTMIGAGIALGDDERDSGPTAVGHLGLLLRTGWFADRVGVVAYGVARPLGVGPALRLEKLRAFSLQGGPLWMTEDRGLRWFAALDLSLAFVEDLGR